MRLSVLSSSPMRSAVLALLILCWGASLVTAQAPLTRPLISEQVSTVAEISIQAQDGYDVIGVVRTPPGSGPFPAVVVVHGGLDTVSLIVLRDQVLNNPTTTRFLAAGYVTMIPTFRSLAADPQTVNALWDNLAIVAYVKQMAQVDPNSVVVYGCSAGGALALELAAEADLAAITAEEPATPLFTGMINVWDRNNRDRLGTGRVEVPGHQASRLSRHAQWLARGASRRGSDEERSRRC